MDMNQYNSEHFLKVADVREGPLKLRIALVREGKFGKPDVIFESGEVLSLNATNLRTLIRAYGTESEDWLGKEIEAALGPVMFEGNLVDSIVVTAISPPIAAAERTTPKDEPTKKRDGDMDDSIPF
jgi:hypothetical protein